MEKLEILKMIKEGAITPDQGVKLIEALEKSDTKDREKAHADGHGRWIKVEIQAKQGGKFKNLTPVRIPFSLIKLFSRFLPKDSELFGHEFNIDKMLGQLQAGEPLDLNLEKEGRTVRISVE